MLLGEGNQDDDMEQWLTDRRRQTQPSTEDNDERKAELCLPWARGNYGAALPWLLLQAEVAALAVIITNVPTGRRQVGGFTKQQILDFPPPVASDCC